MTEGLQRSAVSAAYPHAELTLEQLWVRYFALGGTAFLRTRGPRRVEQPAARELQAEGDS